MNGKRFTVRLPANPLLQAAYFIVGGIVLVVAIFMGAIALLVVFGLALIAGIAIWMRLWWLQRKLLKAWGGHPGAEAHHRGETGRVIEAEYTVVDEQRK